MAGRGKGNTGLKPMSAWIKKYIEAVLRGVPENKMKEEVLNVFESMHKKSKNKNELKERLISRLEDINKMAEVMRKDEKARKIILSGRIGAIRKLASDIGVSVEDHSAFRRLVESLRKSSSLLNSSIFTGAGGTKKENDGGVVMAEEKAKSVPATGETKGEQAGIDMNSVIEGLKKEIGEKIASLKTDLSGSLSELVSKHIEERVEGLSSKMSELEKCLKEGTCSPEEVRNIVSSVVSEKVGSIMDKLKKAPIASSNKAEPEPVKPSVDAKHIHTTIDEVFSCPECGPLVLNRAKEILLGQGEIGYEKPKTGKTDSVEKKREGQAKPSVEEKVASEEKGKAEDKSGSDKEGFLSKIPGISDELAGKIAEVLKESGEKGLLEKLGEAVSVKGGTDQKVENQGGNGKNEGKRPMIDRLFTK